MRNRLRGFGVLLVVLLALPGSVRAQTSARTTLLPPNLDSFPRVEAYLDVRDAQSRFVPGLQVDDVQVFENDQSVPAESIVQLRPGVQLVVSITPGATFEVKTNHGETRTQLLLEVLENWAKSRQGSTLDDWSLILNGTTTVSHVDSPMNWLEKLKENPLEVVTEQPDLNTLLLAVTMAGDQTHRPGMGRAVLFITPPIDGDIQSNLENIGATANQLGVHIFIWMISSPGAFSSTTAEAMTTLANQTGGQFFAYSGEEALPNPEEYLDTLRNIYRVTYASQIKTSGDHRLAVEVQTPEEALRSNDLPFKLDILPPNPVFISPDLVIERRPPTDKANASDEEILAALSPTVKNIQILVDFPDGRVRPVTRTGLYVDGALVSERTEAPFDQFEWDLTPYTTSGQHVLKVAAVDSLGMTGTTMDTYVQVEIKLPPANPWRKLARNSPVLVGLAVVVSGAVILLVLLFAGKIQPHTLTSHKVQRRKSEPPTQPVPTKSDPNSPLFPGWVNKLHWPQRRVTPQANAFLTRLNEGEPLTAATPISITSDEITLGSDPSQASLVLNDATVESLHARILRKEDGTFFLSDEGSVAGTWINYTCVSREGVRVEHGDLVHIGRVGFRFTLRQPTPTRKPVIIPMTEMLQEKQS